MQSPVNEPVEDVFLVAPDFSSAQIMGLNVGIRPFRTSGVRLQAEYLSDKLIIHNYGYGGSGLSLCWGGSQEAMGILRQEQNNHPELSRPDAIAVLGAGIIGITTAYDLLAQGCRVNIYADAFSPHLTSNVAAGIFSAPTVRADMSAVQSELLNHLFAISSQRFLAMAQSERPELSGVKFITDYHFEAESASELKSEKFKKTQMRKKRVRVHFNNGLIKAGIQTRELGIDGKIFIEDLYARLLSRGVLFHQRKFESVRDISGLNEKIIFNCTSMGSKILFNDTSFRPVRGHLIYFKPQPGIDYSLYHSLPGETDYWVKLYPWRDRLILGGVFEHGKDEAVIDPLVIERLLENARVCFNRI
ncbi:putative D-amino-acid oxidase [Aquicella siphonis]|uniref:D-amino-acid oxidase n=1 Tax=Aquicella siphonis TaxID=254247 RepID=A0A5E4PIK1_9COXI|nr:FAD-dependent oxidoreductase [Aquicella siphonis]VVC76395.1 putative D-amino-acid oxidase [Aquicella siphonis]